MCRGPVFLMHHLTPELTASQAKIAHTHTHMHIHTFIHLMKMYYTHFQVFSGLHSDLTVKSVDRQKSVTCVLCLPSVSCTLSDRSVLVTPPFLPQARQGCDRFDSIERLFTKNEGIKVELGNRSLYVAIMLCPIFIHPNPPTEQRESVSHRGGCVKKVQDRTHIQ